MRFRAWGGVAVTAFPVLPDSFLRPLTAAKPKIHHANTCPNFGKFLKDFNNFLPNFGPFSRKQIVSFGGNCIGVTVNNRNNTLAYRQLFRKGKPLPQFAQNLSQLRHVVIEKCHNIFTIAIQMGRA